MLVHELLFIPKSPRPALPPASPRSLPNIPIELPKLTGQEKTSPRSLPNIPSEFPKLTGQDSKISRAVERVRLYNSHVDGIDSRASQPCARQELGDEVSRAHHQPCRTHKSRSQKNTKTGKRKKKRKPKRVKQQEERARVSVMEALYPQTPKSGPMLWRASVDDGLQRVEQHMSEMASQRLAVARKASQEQRARVRERALSRRQKPSEKTSPALDQSQVGPLPPESGRSSNLQSVRHRHRVLFRRQTSQSSSGVGEKEGDRFLSDSEASESSLLSVIKPSRDKIVRMADLHRRATLFKKELGHQMILEHHQTSFQSLPETEQQLMQTVHARAHVDVQQVTCRLAELGLRGKDDKEIESIKAACENYLARDDKDVYTFTLDFVHPVRAQLRERHDETFLDLFKSADRFGINSGLTEEHCLEIMTSLYVGVVSSSDLDALKKELSIAFKAVMDVETAKINDEQFSDLFWHLREHYDREYAERERRIIEKYGIDIDSEDARLVKDELLLMYELLASQSDNQEERKLDMVDVRGIVGIFIETGLLPYGGDQTEMTEQWFKELSGRSSGIDFQDLRRLVERIREQSWEKERQHVERIFEEFDTKNTGSLNLVQISAFFKSLGLVPRSKSDQEELRRLLDEVDVDASGTLDFDEFSRLVHKVTVKLRAAQRRRENEVAKQLDFTLQQLSELREAYFSLDANKNHLLEINECRLALTLMKKDMSGPELNELFCLLDKDHDKRIDFEEFLFFVKAVEQPSLNWRPFIHQKFLTHSDSMMGDGRQALGKLQHE